jgi:hypothetical protein
MSYKTILVHVSTSKRSQDRIQLAAKLAIAENAHLIGLASASAPMDLQGTNGFIGDGGLGLAALMDVLRARAEDAIGEFDATLKKSELVS